MQKQHIGIQLFFYAVLCVMLSLLSGGGSFIVFGAIYLVLILLIGKLISRENRIYFLRITINFLLIYSVFVTFSSFILVNNPLRDYYVGIDETNFFHAAIDLSKLPSSKIWSIALHKYSESPLFYACLGTLKRLTNLNLFYSLLLLKLNVAFVGGFVPAVVYLLCSRLKSSIKAYKAAWVYGLMTFVFFYSVGLMRDIHMALIYAIALYIITNNNYNIINYAALILLAVLAYFIRVENGIFFLTFMGVWMLNSKTNNKVIIYIFSVGILVIGIYFIGGFDLIIHTTTETTVGYTKRSIEMASLGSLGVKLNRLPFPLNYIGKTVSGQIQPFPFWAGLPDKEALLRKIFYFPYVLAGLFWFLVWTRSIVNFRKSKKFFIKYKWGMLLSLIYIILVSAGEANPRRLMAVYPMFFMGYFYVDEKLFNRKDTITAVLIYGLLLIIYAFLK